MRALCVAALLALLPAPAAAQSALTGRYPDLFRQADPALTERAVDAKIARYWKMLFEGDVDERVVFAGEPTRNGPTAYVLDVNNADVRTEGMSYAMMIAVQLDHKAAFDAVWNWAWTHMRYASGPRQGYFRWRCLPSGCAEDAVPASDGEQYFATALLFAAARWGNGQGVYDYAAQANAILDTMLHKQEMNRGVASDVTDMFDAEANQVAFVPIGRAAGFTDPSYHLPAFYEVWARRAAGWKGARDADRRRWREIAATSRAFFARATNPQTALAPDYAHFDGSPVDRDGHGDFRYDAFRTAVNWSVDQAWWGKAPEAGERSDRLQAFFAGQGLGTYVSNYSLDGKPLNTGRAGGLIASNGVASLVATDPRRLDFVRAAWALEPPTGRGRYYDGLLQFMAVLHLSGRFRVW